MEISVKTDIKKATRRLNSIQRKQIPFAVAGALTDTAFDSRKAVQVQLPKKLKNPVKWTINGVLVEKANKKHGAHMRSSVYFADGSKKAGNRAKYMKYQVEGGTRHPARRAVLVPVNATLNKFGNMPNGYIKKIMARPDTFSGTIKGVSCIWQRGHISKRGKWSNRNKSRGSNIRLLVRYEDKVSYRPRFPFQKIVAGVARNKFGRNFNRRLAAALRTAR